MNKLHEQLKRVTSSVLLSEREKEIMRTSLHEYVKMKPLRQSIEAGETPTQWSIWTRHFEMRYVAPALVAALIFVGSGGAAFAAEGAVPGDLLYPVKVHVNEEVRSALAVTEVSKVNWEIERTERRLEEAVILASEGGLDEKKEEDLSNQLDTHADIVESYEKSVEQEDPGQAAEIRSRLGSVLTAHAEVLTELADQEEHDSADESVGRLAGRARDRASRLSQRGEENTARLVAPQVAVAAQDSIEKEDTEPKRTEKEIEEQTVSAVSIEEESQSVEDFSEAEKSTALHLQDASADRIKRAKSEFERREKRLSEVARGAVEQRLDEADGLVTKGSEEISGGDYQKAADSFSEALQLASRIQASLRAWRSVNIEKLLLFGPDSFSDEVFSVDEESDGEDKKNDNKEDITPIEDSLPEDSGREEVNNFLRGRS